MSKRKDRKDKSAEEKPTKEKPDKTVTVALIGAIVTIVVALLGFPPLIAYLTPSQTDTPVAPTLLPPTNTFQPETLTPSPTFIEAITLTFTSTESLTPTFTFTPIPPLAAFTPTLPIGMQVKVIANPPSGKKPLKVKIDARDSFLRAPNGDIFKCRNGACSYTWYLTLPGGQPVKQTEKGGYIDFTFDNKGTYYINVYVCHGSDNPTCNSGGTNVIVE